MPRNERCTKGTFGSLVGVIVLAAGLTLAPQSARADDPDDSLTIRRSRTTGLAAFVTAADGKALPVNRPAGRTGVEPREVMAEYGHLFGVADPDSQLSISKVEVGLLAHTHTTFEQIHRGIRVFSGVLKVHQDSAGEVTAVNGDFYPISPKLEVTPTIDGRLAERLAQRRLPGGDATVSHNELVIVDPGWYGDRPRGPHLAYYLILVDAPAGVAVAFFVDAHTGRVLDQWSLVHTARDRQIYDGGGTSNLPGTLARGEGDSPAGNSDVDAAYDYYGDTYDYFARAFGRDGIDDSGMTMVATVNSTVLWCPNAAWSGSLLQMVFCSDVVTDDIVGHELTHGVTQFSADLIYQNQPGQLNESFSDVFGELIDLFNGDAAFVGPPGGTSWPTATDRVTGSGLDSPNNARSACSFGLGYADGVRWLIGEDAIGFGGALRDMWNPACMGDPDFANSSMQTCYTWDSGGVHSGSGIPNHAFAMLTDGKSFHGYDVTGIGPIKSGAVWYRALTTYLTMGSDFEDAYWAFNQAAGDLVGTFPNDPRTGGPSASMFTSADAEEVDQALLAVEMNTAGTCGREQDLLNPDPPTECGGQVPIFAEDFESGLADWTVSNTAPPTEYDWVATTEPLPVGRSGKAAFCADLNTPCWFDSDDEAAVHHLDSPVINLPSTLSVPTLAFTHLMNSEQGWDGGNLKLSVNGGPWQLVPASAFGYNPYNLMLFTGSLGSNNPLGGESAFTGVSGRWGKSLVHLTGLVSGGESLRIRFDFGKDYCTGADGWYVDDVHVYHCPGSLDCNNNGILDEVETQGAGGQDVVVDHPPSHSDGYWTDSDPDPWFGWTNVLAQRFTLLLPKRIHTIKVWGAYYPVTPPQGDSFTVIFHEVSPATGLPGSTISTQTSVTAIRQPTGYVLFPPYGWDEWEFTIPLPESVSLDPGIYWLEFYNDTSGSEAISFIATYSNTSSSIYNTAFALEVPGVDWEFFDFLNLGVQMIADFVETDCNANGIPDTCDPDMDGDEVPDTCDLCPGADDRVDSDGDTVPDGCDVCPGFPDDVDGDGDGVPSGCDLCYGFDDHLDADGDGMPDACDVCPEADDFADEDQDGVPDGCDICPGYSDRMDLDADGKADCLSLPPRLSLVDTDGDGTPDELDECPDDPDKTEAGACGCGVADPANAGDPCEPASDTTIPSGLQAGDCAFGLCGPLGGAFLPLALLGWSWRQAGAHRRRRRK